MEVMDDLKQKIVKSALLISLPEVYLQLKALLDDPDFTMAEVSLLVGRDPALAARFLQLVNSPLYRRPTKIETIGHAVSMMGSQQVHDIVLSASVCKTFEGIKTDVMDMRKFWHRSMYCATMLRQLALENNNTDSDRLFTIGLLSDIGHLCMYMEAPEKTQEAILESKKKEQPLFLVEQGILGFDYTQIGSIMMKQWNLPASVQMPIACHMILGTSTDYQLESALLHLASILVNSELEDGIFDKGAFNVDPIAWEITGLSSEQCLKARQTAAQQYAEVSENVF